jgi:hypothetical protein
VLSFIYSCLVSYSPSGVWQLKFECRPQVQEISSATTTCPGLEVACCCVCLLRFPCCEFFSLIYSLFLGQVVFHPHPPLLCFTTVDGLLFSFARQFGFGCCSLAQEMISVIHYLPFFREWLIAHLLLVFTAFPVFIYL